MQTDTQEISQEAARAMLAAFADSVEPVGSRVTCNPAPVGTDVDFLVLVKTEHLFKARNTLEDAGFEQGGSQIADADNVIDESQRFWGFRAGEVNVILTASPEFYRRFMAATACAKRFNLLAKADRIALFQAVLYGNAAPPDGALAERGA